jgi:hypothetical protein
MRIGGGSILVAAAVLALGCEPEPVATSGDEGRGVAPAAPPRPPPEAPVHTFARPETPTASFGGGGGGARPPATSPAPATDGGAPATPDGGIPANDNALAAAVDANGRALATCFPATMATLPDVALDFQISVSGMVTRAEVRAEGLDPTVSTCLRSAAEAIRFPEQSAVRSYRYPMRLRRRPGPDGGAAAAPDGGAR